MIKIRLDSNDHSVEYTSNKDFESIEGYIDILYGVLLATGFQEKTVSDYISRDGGLNED